MLASLGKASRIGFALVVATSVLLLGCEGRTVRGSTFASSSPQSAAASVPGLLVATDQTWSPEALEDLLAPVALYPDEIIGHVLVAATDPQEVLDAGNWLLENQTLEGDALDAAAQKVGFGEATRALLHFPTVIDMMCQEIDWTRQLGAAFTSDQKGVLDAVQRLRSSAVEVGNLKTSPQQTVETKSENGTTYVEVKPADPKVVYVPQYDPAVVYTTPPTTTVVESSSGASAGTVLLAFGVGIAIGAAINNSYYPYPHWGYGAVYMGPRPFYPPAYAYRPVYGAGFHPAYAYRPPVNYHNSYNHNTNVNININNNNNYYNRFDGNANMKGGGSRSPIAGNTKASNRAAPKAGTSDWKGKSSYAGARPGNSSKAATKGGGTKAARPANVDRGYGGSSGTRQAASTRPATSPGTRANASTAIPRASASPSTPSRSNEISGSGGYKHTVDANTGANVVSSTRDRSGGSSAASASSASRGGDAFSHGSSGSFDRAASARGQASTSSSYRGGGRSGGGGGGRR